jgi:hypothetical protein
MVRNVLHIEREALSEKYLGLPTASGRLTDKQFEHLVERSRTHAQGWCEKQACVLTILSKPLLLSTLIDFTQPRGTWYQHASSNLRAEQEYGHTKSAFLGTENSGGISEGEKIRERIPIHGGPPRPPPACLPTAPSPGNLGFQGPHGSVQRR